MKALTQKLSSRQMTLFLFGVLALNISWMKPSLNSGDFASTNNIVVGGGGDSRFCPNLSDALQAAKENMGQVVTLTCDSNSARMNKEQISVDRKVHIKVDLVEVSAAQNLAGINTSESQPEPALQYTVWTEVGTEATSCAECTATKSQNITAYVRSSEQKTYSQLAGELGSRIDGLLNSTQSQMLSNAEGILAAALRAEKEDRLMEAREVLEDNCEVLRNTPLEAIEEGQRTGNFGEHALVGEEKFSCMNARFQTMSASERNDYFYTKIMPHLNSMLSSSDRKDQQLATSFMQRLANSQSMAHVQGGMSALMMAQEGAQMFNVASQLSKAALRNPNDPSINMQIDMLKMSINSKFGLVAQHAPLGSFEGDVAGFWNDRIVQQLSNNDPLVQTAIDMSNFTYGNNRWARVYSDTQQYTLDLMQQVQQQAAGNVYDSMNPLANTTSLGVSTNVQQPLVQNQQQAVNPPQAGTRVPRIPVN